jgi:hypothetical protein
VSDLARVDCVRPEALIAGKIMRRSLTLTYGDADTGKSYYCQHTVFELAAFGVPVWYVAAEGFDGIYPRIVAWQAQPANQGKPLDTLRVIPVPVQLFRAHARDVTILGDHAHALPEEEQPQLIVVDTLHRCSSGARENDNSAMGCLADAASYWRAQLGAATWTIHHEGKSAGLGIRGASCLRDDADSVQYIFRGGDISVIECEKQKDGIERFGPEAFTLEHCALDHFGFLGLSANVYRALPSDQVIEARRLWSSEQQRKSGAKNAVGGEDPNEQLSDKLAKGMHTFERCVQQTPEGVFKSSWRQACEEAGIAAGSVNWVMTELVKRGKVVQPDTTMRDYLGNS